MVGTIPLGSAAGPVGNGCPVTAGTDSAEAATPRRGAGRTGTGNQPRRPNALVAACPAATACTGGGGSCPRGETRYGAEADCFRPDRSGRGGSSPRIARSITRNRTSMPGRSSTVRTSRSPLRRGRCCGMSCSSPTGSPRRRRPMTCRPPSCRGSRIRSPWPGAGPPSGRLPARAVLRQRRAGRPPTKRLTTDRNGGGEGGRGRSSGHPPFSEVPTQRRGNRGRHVHPGRVARWRSGSAARTLLWERSQF